MGRDERRCSVYGRMSEHGHHDPGGHELEAINTKLLFRLLISLSFITLLAAAAVVQWFYGQRRELDARHAAEGSYQLKIYKTKMAADLDGLDRLAQEIASKPAMLATPAPPAGWIHPDDLISGVASAPEHAEPEHVEPAHVEEEAAVPVPVELPEPEGDDADLPTPEPADNDAEPAEPAEEPEPAPKPKPKPKQPEPADDGE